MSDTDPEDYSEKLQGSTINADKSVEGNLFIVVDKGKQYELNYTPESYGDKKPKSVTFKIDGKDKKSWRRQISSKILQKRYQLMLMSFFSAKITPISKKSPALTKMKL